MALIRSRRQAAGVAAIVLLWTFAGVGFALLADPAATADTLKTIQNRIR